MAPSPRLVRLPLWPGRSPRARTGALVVSLALVASVSVAVVGAGPAHADGVDRLAGPDRYATAAAVSRSTFDRGVDTVWIANGHTAADALAAGPLAGRDGGPVLLARRDRLPASTADELRQLRPDRIVLVGGTAVLSDRLQRALADHAPTVERVAGPNRYRTAARIARSGWPDGAGTVWLANGTRFPDALAAAPIAGRNDSPILLTAGDRLPQATATAISELDPDRVVVLGGTAAISEQVADQVRALGPDTARRAGANRYATAAEISEAGVERGVDEVYIASGRRFPDALAVAPVAAAARAPVLLTPAGELPRATVDELRRLGPATIVVVGGTAAITNRVRLALLSHADLPPFRFTWTTVDADRLGASWRPGCPIAPQGLRLATLRHVGFDGSIRTGQLVVRKTIIEEVRGAFRALYRDRFPIRRMRTVDVYGADDDASMAADNTSAFNCRPVAGGSSWSRHAYGEAIDINPRENPYVRGSTILPPAGRHWLDRSDERPGMLLRGETSVRAFTSRGFEWGGDWNSLKDYQHVERPH